MCLSLFPLPLERLTGGSSRDRPAHLPIPDGLSDNHSTDQVGDDTSTRCSDETLVDTVEAVNSPSKPATKGKTAPLAEPKSFFDVDDDDPEEMKQMVKRLERKRKEAAEAEAKARKEKQEHDRKAKQILMPVIYPRTAEEVAHACAPHYAQVGAVPAPAPASAEAFASYRVRRVPRPITHKRSAPLNKALYADKDLPPLPGAMRALRRSATVIDGGLVAPRPVYAARAESEPIFAARDGRESIVLSPETVRSYLLAGTPPPVLPALRAMSPLDTLQVAFAVVSERVAAGDDLADAVDAATDAVAASPEDEAEDEEEMANRLSVFTLSEFPQPPDAAGTAPWSSCAPASDADDAATITGGSDDEDAASINSDGMSVYTDARSSWRRSYMPEPDFSPVADDDATVGGEEVAE